MSCTCDFGKGLAVCHCAACCKTFTSSSAFAMHQRIPREGDGWGLVECLDPETAVTRSGKQMFMPYGKTPDGSPVFGRYEDAPRKPPSATQQRLDTRKTHLLRLGEKHGKIAVRDIEARVFVPGGGNPLVRSSPRGSSPVPLPGYPLSGFPASYCFQKYRQRILSPFPGTFSDPRAYLTGIRTKRTYWYESYFSGRKAVRILPLTWRD